MVTAQVLRKRGPKNIIDVAAVLLFSTILPFDHCSIVGDDKNQLSMHAMFAFHDNCTKNRTDRLLWNKKGALLLRLILLSPPRRKKCQISLSFFFLPLSSLFG